MLLATFEYKLDHRIIKTTQLHEHIYFLLRSLAISTNLNHIFRDAAHGTQVGVELAIKIGVQLKEILVRPFIEKLD